jgi:hypothetical protein
VAHGHDRTDHLSRRDFPARDLYDILLERYRTASIVVTSNRGPDEWLATFADPIRVASAIDRFTSNAYDLVIEGESRLPSPQERGKRLLVSGGRTQRTDSCLPDHLGYDGTTATTR